MMSRILMLVLLGFISVPIYSQDLIVTSDNDSLNCQISKVKSGSIFFAFVKDHEIRQTMIPLNRVKSYNYDFFPSGVSNDSVKVSSFGKLSDFPKFRMAVDVGLGYRTGKIPKVYSTELEDYLKKLKRGMVINVDVARYISETLGLGVKFSYLHSENSMSVTSDFDSDGDTDFGLMKDDISVIFVGPILQTRLFDAQKKNALITAFGVGYLGYHDDGEIIQKVEVTGSTVGLVIDLGYDFQLNNQLALVLKVGYQSGNISKFTYDYGITKEEVELENGNQEDLRRLDFTIGLRFNK